MVCNSITSGWPTIRRVKPARKAGTATAIIRQLTCPSEKPRPRFKKARQRQRSEGREPLYSRKAAARQSGTRFVRRLLSIRPHLGQEIKQ